MRRLPPGSTPTVTLCPYTTLCRSSFDLNAFDAFLVDLRGEALKKGLKPGVINTALTGVDPVMRIIQRDRNQAEFKLDFATYRDRVITPANIARGQKLSDDNLDLLRQVLMRYGVQPRFILAIWGIEKRRTEGSWVGEGGVWMGRSRRWTAQ